MWMNRKMAVLHGSLAGWIFLNIAFNVYQPGRYLKLAIVILIANLSAALIYTISEDEE